LTITTAAALVLLFAILLPALGHNWGAGSWGGASVRCLEEDPDSECTPDDWFHFVYQYSSVPAEFRQAVSATVSNDYNPISGFQAVVESSIDSFTDAIVVKRDTRGLGTWIYTTCEYHADYGGGTGYYEWCKPQVLAIDPQKPRTQDCIDDADCMAWVACHEVGHTTGLQHAGPFSSDPHSARDTCMDYDHYSLDPDAHDIEHLVDCFPQPYGAPATLTPACRDYQ
jgi:hypothetical protein